MTAEPALGAPFDAEVVHLRPAGHLQEHTAEQLLISALLDLGEYTPRSYGVPDDAIRTSSQVHAFCADHQLKAGHAPTVGLVLERFPSFRYMPGVSAPWAAAEVMREENSRRLRKALMKAGQALQEDAHDEAVQIMREAAGSTTRSHRPGVDIAQTEDLWADEGEERCPIPPGPLAQSTGGIGPGELWVVVARSGVGKTWRLLEHTIAAAESGWDVKFFSLEMNSKKVRRRMHHVALREGMLPAPMMDPGQVSEAIRRWREDTASIEVFGPQDIGRMDAAVIASAVEENAKTLVIVDYMNKMYTTTGEHSIKDWRVQAQVANEMQEQAGLLGVPILTAAQLNANDGIGGSIQIEQNADLILSVSKLAEGVRSVRKNTLLKNRDGDDVLTWYSRFDPATGRFGHISGEEAMRLRSEESMGYTE
jgi:replicative DNA helicase